MTVVRGHGHGKLLLFGEHAAVYGYPAVGMSLPLRTVVTVSSATSGEHESGTLERGSSRDAGAGARPSARGADTGPLTELFEEALTRLGSDSQTRGTPHRFAVRTESEVPIGVGLGSSAALTVALARAAFALVAGEEPVASPDSANAIEHARRVWLVAHELEKRYHGTPSGIDTGLSALTGARVFLRGSGEELPEQRALRQPHCFLVLATLPRRKTTKELVAEVRRRSVAAPESTRRALDELGAIAEDAARFLGAPTAEPAVRHAERIGELACRAQEELRTIGVSSDTVEEAVEILESSGASGAKLSGAGGGGAVFGVFHSKDVAERARAALAQFVETIEQSSSYRVWVMESRANASIIR